MGMGDTDSDIGDTDTDGDGDPSGFNLFTFRNFVSFFTLFGWTGISMVHMDFGKTITIIVSFLAGFMMMSSVALLFYLVSKMASSGNVSIGSAVGQIGLVYLRIPGKRSGSGKVNVNLKDKRREVRAVTDGEELKTGESVKVLQAIGSDVLLVTKI